MQKHPMLVRSRPKSVPIRRYVSVCVVALLQVCVSAAQVSPASPTDRSSAAILDSDKIDSLSNDLQLFIRSSPVRAVHACNPLSCCAPPCHAAPPSVTLRKPPRHAAHPLSCCAQSQHPEMPVERSELGIPGFRDYARNDEVEDPTLCDQYRDVMLRAPPLLRCTPHLSRCAYSPVTLHAPPCHTAHPPAILLTPLPCCTPPPAILRTTPVTLHVSWLSRNCFSSMPG